MLSLNELVLFFPHHVMVELCYLCMHVTLHHITLQFEQFICHALCLAPSNSLDNLQERSYIAFSFLVQRHLLPFVHTTWLPPSTPLYSGVAEFFYNSKFFGNSRLFGRPALPNSSPPPPPPGPLCTAASVAQPLGRPPPPPPYRHGTAQAVYAPPPNRIPPDPTENWPFKSTEMKCCTHTLGPSGPM